MNNYCRNCGERLTNTEKCEKCGTKVLNIRISEVNKELEILHPKVCESVEEYIEELMKI